MDFVTNQLNQVLSFVLWGVAAALAWYGARRGMPRHLVPRVVLAMGVSGLALTYLADIVLGPEYFADILNFRRGFGWVVAVGIGWSAWTGIKAGQEMDHRVESYTALVLERIERDRLEEEDDG